jgi:hypothetical protein
MRFAEPPWLDPAVWLPRMQLLFWALVLLWGAVTMYERWFGRNE